MQEMLKIHLQKSSDEIEKELEGPNGPNPTLLTTRPKPVQVQDPLQKFMLGLC